jgi:Ser-tRNA(Ala) deacylase AlaX
MSGAEIEKKIEAKGAEVRSLKAGGDKAAITKAVNDLKALKAQYKEVTGKDHGPPPKGRGGSSKKKEKAVAAPAAKAPAGAPLTAADAAAKNVMVDLDENSSFLSMFAFGSYSTTFQPKVKKEKKEKKVKSVTLSPERIAEIAANKKAAQDRKGQPPPKKTAPKPASAPKAAAVTGAYPATKKTYFDDSYQFTSTAKVLAVELADAGLMVVLDATVFYAQGGGQPTDVGTIVADGATFDVTMVKEQPGGFIAHFGAFSTGSFKAGATANLAIDSAARMINMRIHSAGHAIDVAMQAIGMGHLVPTKGYHFPAGPYVEYEGEVPLEERDTLAQKLTEKMAELVAADIPTTVKEISPKDVPKIYAGTGFPADITVLRAAAIGSSSDDFLCPCGGTHVKSTKDLGVVTITKIKKKKTSVQIKYTIS